MFCSVLIFCWYFFQKFRIFMKPMETIVDYFTHIPSSHRSAILVGGLTFFFLLETIIPLFRFKKNRVKHTGINLFFTLTTVVVNFLFAVLILKISDYTVAHELGLLHLVDMPLWLFMLAGILGLDLIGAYLPHMLEHRITFLWRFHLIHHSDPLVDTTTANRHHPLESVIRVIFTMAGVAILGAPVWIVMMYQSLSVILSQFNHANIRLPKALDKAISWFIISPDMHKVHHHYKLPYTDSNYGNIFSIWDRLFRTFTEVKDIKTLRYGLDTYPTKAEHSNLGRLLLLPFGRYRKPSPENRPEIEF